MVHGQDVDNVINDIKEENEVHDKKFWILPSGKVVYVGYDDEHASLLEGWNNQGWNSTLKLMKGKSIRGFSGRSLFLTFFITSQITPKQIESIKKMLRDKQYEDIYYAVHVIKDGVDREYFSNRIVVPAPSAVNQMVKDLHRWREEADDSGVLKRW